MAGSTWDSSRGVWVPQDAAGVSRRLHTGYYYGTSGTTSTVALGTTTLHVIRFEVPNPVTLTRIGLEVTTNAATSVVRLGIYADDGTGIPGSLLVDAGTIDASTTGYKELTISQAVSPGQVWLAAVAQTAGCSVRSLRGDGGAGASQVGLGGLTAANASGQQMTEYQQVAAVTGALPATFGSVQESTGQAPRVLVKIS